MLSISEIKLGKLILVDEEPYVVIKAEHHKMGRGGAVLKIKVKNLITGNVLEKTLQGNEKIDGAVTEKKKVNYIYKTEEEACFMDNTTFEQFSLPLEQLGDKLSYLCEGTDVDALYFRGNPVSIDLPVKVKLKVINAPEGVRGNSGGNVTKKIILETGAEISAPMFINEGDEIIVNTERGEYVERA